MRIGANFELRPNAPAEWVVQLQSLRARAAVAPITSAAGIDLRRAYREAAAENDIRIAEVGVWNNPLDPEEDARKQAVAYAAQQLDLAEELGACCCVNVSGARGPVWDGYYPENRNADTYALLVDTVRSIIDAVRPQRTFYTLEPVGWLIPATPEEYLQLIADVDRPAFAVHMDYTNFITGIPQYMDRMAYIRHCFRLLAPHIKSIHAKDIRLMPGTPCQIQEVLPGEGGIDFAEVLRLAGTLPPDMPLLVEHLKTIEECGQAIGHVYRIAEQEGYA